MAEHSWARRLGFSIPMDWVLTPVTNFVAYACSALTILICTREIFLHLKRYDYPDIQRHIIRILVFAPIYAIDSAVALAVPQYALYLNTLRDVYESFVLYQFLTLLIRYGGGETSLVRSLNSKQYKGKHLWPFGFVFFNLDRHFFVACKRGVLQYCFFKIATALLSCVLHPLDMYVEGKMNWLQNSYPWFFFVNNISITVSLYYLVLFNVELDRDFAKYKPLLKFTAIKIVIFFAFWQGAMLVVLEGMGLLHFEDETKIVEADVATQDFLICVELLPISLLIIKAYGRNALQQEMDEIRLFEAEKDNANTGGDVALESSKGGDAFSVLDDNYKDSTGQASPKKGAVVRSQTPQASTLEAVANAKGAIDLRDCMADAKETFKRQKVGGLLEEAEGEEQTEEKIQVVMTGQHASAVQLKAELRNIRRMMHMDDDADAPEDDDDQSDGDDHDLTGAGGKKKNRKKQNEKRDFYTNRNKELQVKYE